MASLFTQAMDVLFADDSAPGTFTPAASGTPVPVHVILRHVDPALVFVGGQTARAPGWLARLKTSEVPTRPRDGDHLDVGVAPYTVRGAETDLVGTSWVVELDAA